MFSDLNLDNNLKEFLKLKNNNNTQLVYGYKNDNNIEIIYSKNHNEFYVVVENNVLSNMQEIKKYVYNFKKLFSKYPFINYIILDKKNNLYVNKEIVKKINEKINDHILENLVNTRYGKILIPELSAELYYSDTLENMKKLV